MFTSFLLIVIFCEFQSRALIVTNKCSNIFKFWLTTEQNDEKSKFKPVSQSQVEIVNLFAEMTKIDSIGRYAQKRVTPEFFVPSINQSICDKSKRLGLRDFDRLQCCRSLFAGIRGLKLCWRYCCHAYRNGSTLDWYQFVWQCEGNF